MRSTLISLALLALLGSGCAAGAVDAGNLFGEDLDPVVGQTILFVGTDAATLRTNIYQVQPVLLRDDAATDEERNGAVLDAASFTVRVLTDLQVGAEGPMLDDGDTLLPGSAPFAVPDRLGRRAAIIASGYDAQGISEVGRVAVIDLATLEQRLTPDVAGLTSVRFTWLGGHLVLEHRDPMSGALGLSTLELDALPQDLTELVVPGADEVQLAGLLRDSDSFLVTATDADGASFVATVDPWTQGVVTVVNPVAQALGPVRVSRSGDFFATTLTDPESGRRTVAVASLDGAGPAGWTSLTGELSADCGDPSWNPARGPDDLQQLAYACEDLDTGRPDILLWEGTGEPTTSTPPMETLTGGAQPAVPDGSMDGLVLRSRLRWDPTGQVLLFGASNGNDAVDDEAMTLLVLNLLDRRATAVFDGSDGVADLAHFAAASSEPVLLVWDRSASGFTSDSEGRHAIKLVSADPNGERVVRGVELGQALRVDYPLFLGGNTLLYP